MQIHNQRVLKIGIGNYNIIQSTLMFEEILNNAN